MKMRSVTRVLPLAALVLVIGCGGSGAGSSPGTLATRLVSLPANDLVYVPSTQKLLCTVPHSSILDPDCVVSINPATGALGTAVPVGLNPDEMALADDGATLYISVLDDFTDPFIRKFDAVNMTSGIQFAAGNDFPYWPQGLAPMPGAPDTLAVCQTYFGTVPDGWGVAIFDNGVMRPNVSLELGNADYLVFGTNATQLYGGCKDSSPFYRMTVDATGIASHDFLDIHLIGNLCFYQGNIYDAFGKIYDPVNDQQVGTLGDGNFFAQTFALVTSRNRIYFLGNPDGHMATLNTYDLTTRQLVSTKTLPNVPPGTNAASLTAWGAHGLAFLAVSDRNNQIVIIDDAP